MFIQNFWIKNLPFQHNQFDSFLPMFLFDGFKVCSGNMSFRYVSLKPTIIHCHHCKCTDIFIEVLSTIITYAKLSSINKSISEITKDDKHCWLNRTVENFFMDFTRIWQEFLLGFCQDRFCSRTLTIRRNGQMGKSKPAARKEQHIIIKSWVVANR